MEMGDVHGDFREFHNLMRMKGFFPAGGQVTTPAGALDGQDVHGVGRLHKGLAMSFVTFLAALPCTGFLGGACLPGTLVRRIGGRRLVGIAGVLVEPGFQLFNAFVLLLNDLALFLNKLGELVHGLLKLLDGAFQIEHILTHRLGSELPVQVGYGALGFHETTLAHKKRDV